jgi:hypothetical protein
MKSNCNELAEYIPFAEEFGFQSLMFNPVLFLESEENMFNRPDFDGRGLAAAGDFIRRKCAELNLNLSWTLPAAPQGRKHGPLVPAPPVADGLFCRYPWQSLWASVVREGGIFPDHWCQEPVGNILTDTFLQAWNSEKMQEYRRRIIAHDAGICNKTCTNGYSAAVNQKEYPLF